MRASLYLCTPLRIHTQPPPMSASLDMSYLWALPFAYAHSWYATWILDTCETTHSYTWHACPIYEHSPLRMHTIDVRHDSFLHVTRLIHTRDTHTTSMSTPLYTCTLSCFPWGTHIQPLPINASLYVRTPKRDPPYVFTLSRSPVRVCTPSRFI